MKAGIAGAGAVGCHYGSMLQQVGVDTVFLTRGAHLQALQTSGMTHHSLGKTTHLEVQASDDVSTLSDCDVVLIACKTTGLEAMCNQLAAVVSEQTVLLTMQNGVEAPEIVQRHFPENPLIAASAFIGARIDSPGVVLHSAAGHLRLGIFSEKQRERAEKVLAELIESWQKSDVDAVDVNTNGSQNIRNMLWHKMLWNCGFNAITALTHRFAKDIAVDADTVRWVNDAMLEAAVVAKAMGVELPEGSIEQHIAQTVKGGEVKTSMWQDMEQGRPTEIAAMNGYISRQAKKLGIAAPVNDLLSSLIHAAEGSTR